MLYKQKNNEICINDTKILYTFFGHLCTTKIWALLYNMFFGHLCTKNVFILFCYKNNIQIINQIFYKFLRKFRDICEFLYLVLMFLNCFLIKIWAVLLKPKFWLLLYSIRNIKIIKKLYYFLTIFCQEKHIKLRISLYKINGFKNKFRNPENFLIFCNVYSIFDTSLREVF